MKPVSKRDDIVINIKTLEEYLKSGSKEEKEFAIKAIKESPALLVYKVNGENRFAPAGFVAYKGNKMSAFKDEELEDRDISNIMTKIVGLPFSNSTIVEKFADYCASLGKTTPEVDRQFWRIKDERRKNLDLAL